MIYKDEIDYLEGSLVKPSSLRQIIADTNELLKSLSGGNDVELI